jgi:hypothetical protein
MLIGGIECAKWEKGEVRGEKGEGWKRVCGKSGQKEGNLGQGRGKGEDGNNGRNGSDRNLGFEI